MVTSSIRTAKSLRSLRGHYAVTTRSLRGQQEVTFERKLSKTAYSIVVAVDSDFMIVSNSINNREGGPWGYFLEGQNRDKYPRKRPFRPSEIL